MLGTELISETSIFNELTRLIARKICINDCEFVTADTNVILVPTGV
jgi:hypothetical protein